MLADDTVRREFAEFVEDNELRLRQALIASFGPDVGRDAAAEALAYGWENWHRVSGMENTVGYLYRVGQTKGRRMIGRRRPKLPPVATDRLPWVEPGLPAALQRLSDKQRQVVLMLHAYEWSMSEVAEVMGITKATVQSYDGRAMRRLRRSLKVNV